MDRTDDGLAGKLRVLLAHLDVSAHGIRFWRRSCGADVATGRDGDHALSGILLRSKEKLALPYIDRLMVLILLTAPSTGPEFHGMVRPAMTASRSRRSPVIRECSAGSGSACTRVIQSVSRSPRCLFIRSANSRTCSAVARSSGQAVSAVASRSVSSSL